MTLSYEINAVPRLHFNNTVEREQFFWRNFAYDYWIAMILLEGSFSLTMRGKSETVNPQDVVIFPQNESFSRHVIKPIRSLYIRFDLETEIDKGKGFPRVQEVLPIGKLMFADRTRVTENIARLTALANIHTQEALNLSSHYFNDIWYEYLHSQSIRYLHGIPEITDPMISSAVRYLCEHYDQPIQIAALADAHNISHVGFTNRFTRCTGITPITYLTNIRMKRACELLTETTLPVSTISAQCGYDNPLYFSRVFHRCIGMPPSEYRSINLL